MTNPRREVAVRMADAAAALLDSLDTVQRATAAWRFDDHDERVKWFYTPTDHGGLAISAMSPAQQRLTHRLLATGLSRPGYVTVATIMGLDNVLDELEGWGASWGRDRGRDPGLYYVRIFGDPTGTDPWSWRFGGHHVSVQHTIVDGEVAGSTPNFLGADPASSPLLGPHLLRPLAGAEDLGRELVRSLDDEQLHQALLAPVAPVDLVSANRPVFAQGTGDLPLPLSDVWRTKFSGVLGERVHRIQVEAEASAGLTSEHLEAVRLTAQARGLSATLLRADQRDLLRTLLDVYVNRMPDALADQQAAGYRGDAGLDGLKFAWAGGMDPGQGHYYRVQGATLLAEYDNTQRGANHVHTVWRSTVNDFGLDVLKAHYETGHHETGHQQSGRHGGVGHTH